ncbi:hypothetical protein [Aquimarina longa]|uniref:hypothetical protein n=1 Tax=Aquimarina longa TaxID=1080221 RepID=UPI000782072A|nr:hypothetical protein [Aquimarina longa]
MVKKWTRVYNPRLGKFLSTDSLFKSFPWYTPYQFAGNKPIIASDLDGLEEKIELFYSTTAMNTRLLLYKDNLGNPYGLGDGLLSLNIYRKWDNY